MDMVTTRALDRAVPDLDRSSRDRGTAGRMAAALERVWVWAWPVALVTALYELVGRVGLAQPDEGFILAQSRRILAGQMPHRDFISPRPIGSVVLHCLDFLVPLPLIEASRLVSAAEVVTYTVAFAALAFGKRLRQWSLAQVLAVSAAVFLNIHSFPLMAWHTIDGLMLIAVGLLILDGGLRRSRLWRCRTGLIALGAAMTVKQSFALAGLLGLAMIWSRRRDGESPPLTLVEAAMWVAALPALYAVVVTLAGGLGPMITQFSHAPPTFGVRLVTSLGRNGPQPIAVVGVAAGVLVCALWALRLVEPERSAVPRATFSVLVSGLVLAVVVVTKTDPGIPWGALLVMFLAVTIAWQWLSARVVDRFGLSMLVVAWMVTLSWGYPTARLIAGTVAITIFHRLWSQTTPVLVARFPARRAVLVTVVVGVLAGLVASTALDERNLVPFLNQTSAPDDRTIGAVVPALAGLRIDSSATTLLRQVAECARQHPAHWTAVLPGPAIVYAVMGFTNPFPVDWVIATEITGSNERMLRSAQDLDTKGNYLVMTAPPEGGLPVDSIVTRMTAELHGELVHCDGLTAIYAPAVASGGLASRPR
jgi:hypothetical protein